MSEKILLTGASGFIGTNLLEDLLAKGYEVKNLDWNEPKIPARKNLWENVNIINYEDFEKAVVGFNPDYIVHLAARTDLDGKTLEDYDQNITGVENLMKIIHKLPNLKKIIITSSKFVTRNGYKIKNQHDYCPHTKYGESKVDEDREDFKIDKNFDELYNIAVTYGNFGKFGKIYKEAYDTLLGAFEQRCSDEKVIYAYISDLDAFSQVYFNQEQYVRLEQYRDKEMGIIRFSKRKENLLKNSSSQKMIVFNLWQFVKHIAIHERMNFEEYFIYPSYRSKILLDQILIGIDYSLWIEEVVFSYTLDSKIDINKAIYCERLEQFINNVIIPKFDSMSEISYESYYRKIFISFLYGDAKNVEDLLFLHIYQWHKIILGKSKLRERYTDEKQDLIDNKNVEFKFSTKRFYQIAMKRFDSTFNNEYDRLNAYGTLRRESNMLFYDYKKDDIKMILSNIKKACEAITYDRTILYRQCQEYLLRYRGE